jgi:hypothetical protein
MSMNERWDSVVRVLTSLRASQRDLRIPAGERDFTFLHNFQAGSGAHPASFSMGTGVISKGNAAVA